MSRVLPEEPVPEKVSVEVQLSEGRLRSAIDQERNRQIPQRQIEKQKETPQTGR